MSRRAIIPILAILGVLLLVAGGWRLKRHFVPDGVRPTAFMFYTTEPQTLVSPSGRTLHIRFNDGGAMHSGLFWTYLYTDHWFWGKRLALGGYSLSEVSKGDLPLPLTWTGDDSFTVEFAAGRHDPRPASSSGTLP